MDPRTNFIQGTNEQYHILDILYKDSDPWEVHKSGKGGRKKKKGMTGSIVDGPNYCIYGNTLLGNLMANLQTGHSAEDLST